MAAEVQRINSLTSLRFFAALLIVLGHSRGVFFDLWYSMKFAFFQGVSFFFVLSGFILTYTYPTLTKEGVKKFYIARFARIWPAHIASLLLYILIFFTDTPKIISQKLILLTNVAMIHAWIPNKDYYFSFNAPSWSISTEALFYICFPLLIYRWRQTWVIKLIISLSIVIAMIAVCNKFHLPEMLGVPSVHALIYINPMSRIFEFILGMTVALAYYKLKDSRISVLQISLLEITALLLIFISLSYSEQLALKAEPIIGLAGQYWVRYSSTCFLFAYLILLVSMQKGIVSRLLSHKILVMLGEISYSLYLIHDIFMQYFNKHHHWAVTHHTVESYATYWVIILGLSYLMWKYIECPARAYIKQLSRYQFVWRKSVLENID